jgi:predicted nucleic acid-binding protein
MFLLDTNVVSELRKVHTGKANPGLAAWAGNVVPSDLFLSVITLEELEIGILLAERRDPAKGAVFRQWMNTQVLPTFSGRVFPVDLTVALRCARLHVPDVRPERDALIAATALVHGMIVVTRNTADFVTTGVRFLNPWS